MIALFGGAAGSGKTTIARLWCESRSRSVHVQLDEIRDLIISGRADPQVVTPAQKGQYSHCVSACVALVRSYTADGYDVAIDDVFEPEPTRVFWLPLFEGLDVRLVVLQPSLETALSRMRARRKKVMEEHVRSQHSALNGWPASCLVDSSNQTAAETIKQAIEVLNSAPPLES